MYSRPPLRVEASIALIIGTANVTLLAAPGVGLRYRLSGLWAMLDQGVAAATQTAGIFVDTAGPGGIIRLSMGWGSVPHWGRDFPEPGVTLNPNGALRFDITATAAGAVARCGAFYYLDDAS